MTFPFNPKKGLVFLKAEITGPGGRARLRFALDTGATQTLVNAAPLVGIGYDPALATKHVQVTTGSGTVYAPVITATSLGALGHDRPNFQVLCHTLPPSATVDGLLGLDFFRDHVLTLDFQQGQIELA